MIGGHKEHQRAARDATHHLYRRGNMRPPTATAMQTDGEACRVAVNVEPRQEAGADANEEGERRSGKSCTRGTTA